MRTDSIHYISRAYIIYLRQAYYNMALDSAQELRAFFIPFFRKGRIMSEILLETKKAKSKKHVRLPNGFGSVVTLSGNRRRPFQARKTIDFNDKGHPIYKTIGYHETWMDAYTALVIYNQNNGGSTMKYERPMTSENDITFADVYERWYQRKYNNENKKLSKSSEGCTKAAYKKCKKLYDKKMSDIKAADMQSIIDDFSLSHAMMEHVKNLLRQMSKYALEFDIIQKNYADFLTINKMDDDESGVPFSDADIALLWKNIEKPYVDTILIFIYTGWRANELLKMPLDNISIEDKTMVGGSKTNSGKNRIVPIHPKIFNLVENRYSDDGKNLFISNGISISYETYRKIFVNTLKEIGITDHTTHDCRHTFSNILSNAGCDQLARKLLMGHSIADLTDRVYTHKDVDFLRREIEKI